MGLRRAATRKRLSQSEREPVDKAADYLANNQARLPYAQALEQGLPTAAAVIEGACRHLVKDRMDITGARSGLERAEAILKLRSLKISGDLDAYLKFHFYQEHKRHYPAPANTRADECGSIKWSSRHMGNTTMKPRPNR